jgi:glycosyltransferase involved in cell wall biosynthesis
VDQSQRPAEVFLIDDASGDETLDVLQEIARSFPDWVKVIALPENQGPGSARNAGWDAATQPFIAFLDADDSWHPEKLRVQYGVMRDDPSIDLSGHQRVDLYNDGELPAISETIVINKIRGIELIYGNKFSTPTVMLKRQLPFRFEAKKRYAEDLHLWRQIALGHGTVVRLESPLAYIHKAPYGASGLSADMWAMEKGELSSLRSLYATNHISWGLLALGSTFSIAKYVRRMAYVQLARIFGAAPSQQGSKKENSTRSLT